MTVAEALSTVGGIGRAPWAPGTIASLAALPFAWGVQLFAGSPWLAAAALAVFGAGVWASAVYARDSGNADPSDCVIDEVAGQWIACALAPLSWPGYLLAFALFRLFDIAKTWPVSWGEEQKGGLGIMLDDLIAGAMAGLIVAIVHNAGVF